MLQPAGAPCTLQLNAAGAGAVVAANVPVGVGVGVEVGVEEGVKVGVEVGVAEGVLAVAEGVGVGVLVGVGVGVGVAAGVFLGCSGVSPESDSLSIRNLPVAVAGVTRCEALSSRSTAARSSRLVDAIAYDPMCAETC